MNDRIFFIGMQGNCKVAGKSPCRGGPDYKIRARKIAYTAELALVVADLELYINRGAFVVLVFDLCLRKSCFVMRAPINGLESFINISLLEHLAENADLTGFKGRSHCCIGMLPVAADAETDELASLAVDIVLRKLVACIAEFGDRHLFAVDLVLLDYSTFDRHTVVVPAGNIRCVVALHRFGFYDKVLEYLVHRGAHVDIAVREGRSVMENKLLMPLIFLQHEGVKIYFVPIFEHFGLALGKIGAHGEGC